MKNRRLYTIFSACLLMTILGCGPDGIFIRQGLDTPSHHVDNGHLFMNSGKLDAATKEFNRALELDPNYAPAYVGLGLIAGHQGKPDKGMDLMEKARLLARDEAQQKEVDAGLQTLKEMAGKN